MKTLTSLPIAICLALSALGCDEAVDLDELEMLERELGEDAVSDALDDDALDFDLTAKSETLPDPHPGSELGLTDRPKPPLPPCPSGIDDFVAETEDDEDDEAIDDFAAQPRPGCDPNRPVPFEADNEVPIPPGSVDIDDMTYGEDEEVPDRWPVDDFVAGQGN